jgi:anthranilate phosphoribosyltransferase
MQLAIDKVINYEDLTEDEMFNVMNTIMEGKATPSQIGGILAGLRMKGETIEEIIGAAKVMREKAAKIQTNSSYTVDTCGTGGDKRNTFNISTASAFIAAAASVTIVKHGNRSVSSKCGSADVLERLGVNIDLCPIAVKKCIDELQIGFIFAPNFHQTMKYAINPRRELGIRTIFNVLGPLTNPANPKGQVLGVFNENLTSILANVLRKLGLKRAMVVYGMDGLDEITITAKTKVSELKDNKIHEYYLDPNDYGISFAKIEEVEGGDPEENAKILLNILKGEKGPKRDMVLLNAGAAMYVGNVVNSLGEGIDKSKEMIDKGLALEKLNQLIKLSQELRK